MLDRLVALSATMLLLCGAGIAFGQGVVWTQSGEHGDGHATPSPPIGAAVMAEDFDSFEV